MRRHAPSSIVPLVGWAAASLALGLPVARRLDWSHGWLWKGALLAVLAPVASLLLLLLLSAIVFGVIIVYERRVLRRK